MLNKKIRDKIILPTFGRISYINDFSYYTLKLVECYFKLGFMKEEKRYHHIDILTIKFIFKNLLIFKH